MTRLLALLLLCAASTADAIVVRDDVDDARYRVDASELPALVDLPGEGHGVLIAPTWILTAAHTVAGNAPTCVTLGDACSREVFDSLCAMSGDACAADFSAVPENTSVGRSPNGSGAPAQLTPTPEAANP